MACENCGGCSCSKVEITDGALGGQYMVPAKDVADFKNAVAKVHREITGGSSWQAAKDALDAQFSQYRVN